MSDEKKKRKKVWYAQIGLSQETYKRLSKVKAVKETELGISLSWNEFFTLDLKERDEALAGAKK